MTYDAAIREIEAKYSEGQREILVPRAVYLGYDRGLMSIERSGPPRPLNPPWLAYKDARVHPQAEAPRWTWTREGRELVDQTGRQVLYIDLAEFIEDEDKRLIAAAPRLAAALDSLCQSWERRRGRDDAAASYQEAIAALYDAVGLERAVKC